MRILYGIGLIIPALIGILYAATSIELEAKKFVDSASERYYKLYDGIAAETYAAYDPEDFETVFAKVETAKKIASELVGISEEAKQFDLSAIQNVELKKALKNLRLVGDLFVLGEDYFTSVVLNLQSLKKLATDKDVEPYMNGIYMPNHDNSPLAYYPDIQKIYRHSNDSEELKYYWEQWRESNLFWSSTNFYSIVVSIQEAAKALDIPVIEYWYRYYDNKDFLDEMQRVVEEIKPLYQQLHAFVRQELHKRYGGNVVDPNGPIPDHLFQQVLEQAWTEGSVIESYFPLKELPPYDDFIKGLDAKQMLGEAERFYTSLGFDALDEKFHNEHLKVQEDNEDEGSCRADIFDLTPNVYMKYCKKVDFKKFMQAHGDLGHVYYAKQKKDLPAYYFNSYDLQYPVGEAVILSASSPKHLEAIGLTKNYTFSDHALMNRLLRMGIHTILNIPLYYVHNKVMHHLLNGTVEFEGINRYYWKQMETYAGIEPPSDRSEGAYDFPYKFFVDIETNHQTKKFVSEILGYQLYHAFCHKCGQTSLLHNCDFYGNLAIGSDLKAMMSLGSSKPWCDVLAKVLPNNPKLSGSALVDYYKPIMDWVNVKNVETKAKIGWKSSEKKIL